MEFKNIKAIHKEIIANVEFLIKILAQKTLFFPCYVLLSR